MKATLPSLAGYLDALPDGIDSHPDARAKATLYRSVIDSDTIAAADILPGPLQRLVETPPPVTAWIPEVHSHAMIKVVRDLRFDSDEDFIRFTYERQRTLFDGRLYRIMLALASPSMLLRTAALRWRTFHRGSTFTVEEASGTETRVRVDYAAGLWDRLLADALAAGLQAALDLSGALDATLHISDLEPTMLRIHGTWRTPR
ncbi:MAG: hypothetical protein ACE37F_37550 [Nannocystaceae bacterium]|nr:hypothetical protein [bacterium]